jgi:hypothetical protein
MTALPSPTWLPVLRDGDDLVVPRAAATWFGGDDDPGDNGQTASGVPTRGHPTLLGCALPLAGYGLPSLRGTPLPMMAFGLHHDGTPNPDGAWVEVSALRAPTSNIQHPTPNIQSLTLPVIDLGPALRTHHGIDLTVAAFQHLAGDLSQGVIAVTYRLKRGALYLKTASPSNIPHPIGGSVA